MPKISTHIEAIHHKDIKKSYEIVIWYNQDYLFYAKFNDEFLEALSHLTKEERDNLGISRFYKGKYPNTSDNPVYVVSNETELGCIKKMTEAIVFLLDKTISKRDVIIIFFDENERGMEMRNTNKNSKEFPRIGLGFGLTYAVETTSGEKTIYSIYEDHTSIMDEKITTIRKEISLWRNEGVVIPDTKENRRHLEDIYNCLSVLISTLKEVTENKDVLLKFIESKVKLLN